MVSESLRQPRLVSGAQSSKNEYRFHNIERSMSSDRRPSESEPGDFSVHDELIHDSGLHFCPKLIWPCLPNDSKLFSIPGTEVPPILVIRSDFLAFPHTHALAQRRQLPAFLNSYRF
jgi:hypothetical protein